MADEALSAEMAFARLVEALRPHLEQLVFVGGWAHRLFSLHELAHPPDHAALMTEDADVAVPSRINIAPPSILELLQGQGFIERIDGQETPPATRYELAGAGGFYAEFLQPRTGAGVRRDGQPDAAGTVSGVTAQKLKHVDILLIEPWSITISEEAGFQIGTPARVRIPNATSYLQQKLLVLPERRPDKQPKDMLYVHDTIALFGDALGDLGDLWKKIAPQLHANRIRDLGNRRKEMFSAVTDLHRGAAEIARSSGRASPPAPDLILERCRVGLAEVFGS